MKRLIWLATFTLALFCADAASAQTRSALTVPTCAATTYWVTGAAGALTVLPDGSLCISGAISVSASVAGFPTVQSTGTPIAVTTGGVTGTLPTGAVVVATNVGTTNAAYCKLGASATTSDQYIAPSGGWFAFTVGANTQLTCITSTSTTTVNMVGGSGLPTGTGGGGGGSGGGGAITAAIGSYALGAFSVGAGADGWDVGVGATTAAVATVGSTGSVNAKLRLMTSQLDSINTNIQAGAGATGSAPPASAIYPGGNGSGATGGLLRGNIICDQHTFYTGTDTGSKTLVAGVSGRKTYICGWLLTTGTTATTLTLFKGTDADCATSGAAIGPPYALLANDKVGVNSPTWNGFVTATNADYVCINAGAANQHTAEIWYAIL